MEVILEVVHANGSRTWHRVGAQPLTLGRGFSNDIILHDPYVDARHARVRRDESGALALEDLGSVNGLVVNAERMHGAIGLQPGAEVRVGRTTLRIHDPDEVVSAALPDEVSASRQVEHVVAHAVSPPPAMHVRQHTPPPALGPQLVATALAAAAAVAMGFNLWLGSAERASGSSAVSTTLGFILLAVVWAAIWAGISRVVIHRFSFASHLAVFFAAFLVVLATVTLQDWLNFLFPDSQVVTTLSAVVNISLVAALIAWHLRFSSGLRPRHRWRIGVIGAAIAVGIGLVFSLTEKEAFSDVPVFSSAIKPVDTKWIPTSTLEDFSQVSRTLKEQVDAMSAQK